MSELFPIIIETKGIPSMEHLSEVYAEHIGELGDLLQVRLVTAETASSCEIDEARMKAQVSQTIEGKNETERKAALALALQGNEDYNVVLAALATNRQRLLSLDISIELKRLRMRLLGWQMEWVIAQAAHALQA